MKFGRSHSVAHLDHFFSLLRADVGVLLGRGAFHEEHENHQRYPQSGAQPEDVEK